MPENIYDTKTARIALRSDGSCGFIFFNNYQRNPKLKPTEMLQVEIENGNKKEILPLEPISIPSDAYFFIPWNLPLCDHKLFYSTTQPICRIDDEKRSLTIYVFKECKGITPEYVFHGDISNFIENNKGYRCSEIVESFTRIYDLNYGIENPIVIKSNNSNRKIQIITLSEDQAERCFKVYLNGKERLAICKTHNIYTQNNTINVYGIELEGELLIYPCHNETININNMKCRSLKIEDNILYVQFGFEDSKNSFDVKEVDFEKSKYDKYLFMEKDDEPYKKQYMISIDLDKNARKVDDLLLEIDYVGDVIQAILNDEPVNDDFYDGFNKFYVSLMELDYPERIKIKISPLHKGKKIYLQKWPELDVNRISRIENIRILPVFKGQIEFEDKI